MRQLVITPRFRRAYRKMAKRDGVLREHVDEVLKQMQADVFVPALGTHKLGGALFGLWACSCGYDCRVIFGLEVNKEDGGEVILLIDIGSHDEVY